MRSPFKLFSSIFLILVVMYGCDLYRWSDFLEFRRHGNESVNSYGSTAVMKWDEAVSKSIGNLLPPPAEARIYAMVTLAMHDALNNVIPKYETYAFDNGSVSYDSGVKKHIGSVADAAVSQSAHDVLVSVFPGSVSLADSLLEVILSAIEDSEYKSRGIQIGQTAAQAMLSARQDDVLRFEAYQQGTEPGEYKSTIPFVFENPPIWPANAAYAPMWGEAEPFGILSGDQFMSDPPYEINSPEYAADYNEVMSLGSHTSTARTEEQTEMGVFLTDNMASTWNRVVRIIVSREKLNGWEAARMFALVHMAQADALIADFNVAYFYNFWRPVTAIHEGETDGNDDTAGDPEWSPMQNILATPPLPSYPSGYAAGGFAGSEVLRLLCKTDRKSFTIGSYSLPGVERSYTSFSQLADEMGESRIFAGHHFRNDNIAGNKMGVEIGGYVFKNNLREIRY